MFSAELIFTTKKMTVLPHTMTRTLWQSITTKEQQCHTAYNNMHKTEAITASVFVLLYNLSYSKKVRRKLSHNQIDKFLSYYFIYFH